MATPTVDDKLFDTLDFPLDRPLRRLCTTRLVLSSADPIKVLCVRSCARRVSVLPRRRWQWANPHLYVADSGTGEQPAREEPDRC